MNKPWVSRKMATKTKIRSTKAQVKYIIQYMLQNKDFARGEWKTPQRAAQFELQWAELKAALDELGPHRSVEQWKTCWRDQKRKARAEGRELSKPTDATDNASTTPGLSDNLSFMRKEMAIEMGWDSLAESNGLKEDMENYIKYNLVGGQLKLKKGVLPHKFECQKPQKKLSNDNRQEAGCSSKSNNDDDNIESGYVDKDASGDGLDVSDNSEQETFAGKRVHETTKRKSPLQQMTSSDNFNELVELKKKKAKVEIQLMKEKVEIARREKYKLDLELLKMERELGMSESIFTAPYVSE
ncbi:uncharacterized protein LOC114353378 isoform X2 [Ostrinia furnacalis]|uniref:uncharacterized protein LOC114353378 isoform X2 n=1 Tax=Ostrinia furnacalis TaxID=93504 RepID=UPI001040D49E|nr:uncharacterized protein LOC114353378 isoform X2 [Ostrinia furnacalis]